MFVLMMIHNFDDDAQLSQQVYLIKSSQLHQYEMSQPTYSLTQIFTHYIHNEEETSQDNEPLIPYEEVSEDKEDDVA